MSDRHKRPPISCRPPAADRERLDDYAKRSGRTVNSILTDALTAYLNQMDDARTEGPGEISR